VKKTPYRSGFTLIELMLVSALLGVIGVGVYGTFSSGINIWKTVTQESINEDISIFFEKISYDLRNTFKYTGMRFRGDRMEVSFPAPLKSFERDQFINSIGAVTYAFDHRKRAITKRDQTYSQFYQKKAGDQRILVEDISSLSFRYYVYEPDKKKYSWVTSWQEDDQTLGRQVEENVPLIVRIEVDVPKKLGKETYVKNVAIPSACCWPFEDEEI